MFRSDLQARFHRIFGLRKTTYSAPSDSFEQDTLFISISNCVGRISSNKAKLKASGSITVFSQEDKLPFGFFQRMIEKADFEDTKDLFFFNIDTDLDTSAARMQNIHERRCDFVFLFQKEVDPNKGSLTSLEISGSFEA